MQRPPDTSSLLTVSAVMEGTEAAFSALYEAYHGRFFRFFQKKVQQYETARELTQLSFIKLWQTRHNLSTAYTLDVQCFTIASSVLIDHIRYVSAQKRKVRVFDINEAGSIMVQADGSFEQSDYLSMATEKLTPVRKQVFILKLVHGYSNKEVAQELSISVKTVEDHYSKALRQLRAIFTVSQLFLFLHP